jgi:hypothetical protein
MNELARFKGNGGTIIVFEDRVMIKRSWIAAMGTVGSRTYPYSTIGSVVYRKPGLTDGYIQFIMPGNVSGTHDNLNLWSMKDVLALAKDPNILLISGNAEKAEEIYNLIMQKINEYNRVSGNQTAPSEADELEKFAALKAKGIISEEEFMTKKKQILGE